MFNIPFKEETLWNALYVKQQKWAYQAYLKTYRTQEIS